MLKSILEFILNETRLNVFFITLLITSPFIGLFAGYIAGLVNGFQKRSIIMGLICGVSGSLISVMWWIYNVIMNHYGLDSVKALLINLVLFISAGIVYGLIIRRILQKIKPVS